VSVLVAISDLFFSSKIDGALALASGKLGAARAKRGVDLAEQVRAIAPTRLVVELGSRGYAIDKEARLPVIDAIRALKADPRTSGIEIVGYCRHTEVETIRAARSAGADRVLTQGEFAELLSSLLDPASTLAKGAASCE
jgi:hypothetical protein